MSAGYILRAGDAVTTWTWGEVYGQRLWFTSERTEGPEFGPVVYRSRDEARRDDQAMIAIGRMALDESVPAWLEEVR